MQQILFAIKSYEVSREHRISIIFSINSCGCQEVSYSTLHLYDVGAATLTLWMKFSSFM